ncbi:MAG: hypothetical protein HQL72_02300 [Magnetococcales bacterium]|nr:hypothetical protein [Magnetococcales bacterium]
MADTVRIKKTAVLVKEEVAYGVDPVPTGGANAVQLHNLSLTPMAATEISRDLIGRGLGAQEKILAEIYEKLSCEVELAGAGAAGDVPGWAAMLKACGMGETINAGVDVVYKPISDNIPSVTIYFYRDGNLHKMVGARGSWGLKFTAQQIPYLTFEFAGLRATPVSEAFPTPDLSQFQKPKVVNKGNTPTSLLHGATVNPLEWTFNNQAQAEPIFLVGSESIELLDRNITGQTRILSPKLSTKDYFAIALAETTGALQIIHGTQPGNIIQIDAPGVQLLSPNFGDHKGSETLDMGLSLVPTDTGDDEITITVM